MSLIGGAATCFSKVPVANQFVERRRIFLLAWDRLPIMLSNPTLAFRFARSLDHYFNQMNQQDGVGVASAQPAAAPQVQ